MTCRITLLIAQPYPYHLRFFIWYITHTYTHTHYTHIYRYRCVQTIKKDESVDYYYWWLHVLTSCGLAKFVRTNIYRWHTQLVTELLHDWCQKEDKRVHVSRVATP